MGAIISLGSTAACCFGSAACAICNCCPSMCNSSIASRIMYSILLLLTTVVCCIMLAPGLQDSLASVPFCKSHGSSLAEFSQDLDNLGSQVGLGDVGAGMGLGVDLQVRFFEFIQSAPPVIHLICVFFRRHLIAHL